MIIPIPVRAQGPASPGGDTPPSRPDASRHGGELAGRSIMVVEDESLIALLIGDSLEDAGATVVGPCYTLAESVRAARSERLDAAVLDVDLAGEDVFPAADELRARGIPFICRKPVEMGDLVHSVARLVNTGTVH